MASNMSIAQIRQYMHGADVTEAKIDAELAKLTPEQIAAGRDEILKESWETIHRLKRVIDEMTI